MKKFIIAMMSVLFLIVGCQVEVIENSSEDNSVAEFIAISESFDGNTKTILGKDNNILWSQGDQLAIFQGCNIADKYQITDATAGTGQGVFSIVSDESGSINGDFSAGMEIATNIAFYPYMESLSCSKNNVDNSTSEVTSYNIDNIILPEVQYYAENSFCNGSFPMVAVTEGLKDHTLKFKNVLGAMKLQLKGSQIVKSIKITGKNNEKLSGAAIITSYINGLTPAITMIGDDDSSKSVTLDCGDGVQLNVSTATEFIIALPPVLFSNGFKVIIIDSENTETDIESKVANTVVRSSILSMPTLVLGESISPDEGENESIPIGMISLDYTSMTIAPNTSYKFITKIAPNDATDKTITWSSSAPNIVATDQTGTITGLSAGTATITAVSTNGVSKSCEITVKSLAIPIEYIVDDVSYGYGIAIGKTVWAPVNCGYEPENGDYKGYPYGKLYQWGRKYGQGYSAYYDSTMPEIVEGPVSMLTGQSESNKNIFFTSTYEYNSDWLYPSDNTLWNLGTEKSPIKNVKNDPCPDGWRVPTYTEVNELLKWGNMVGYPLDEQFSCTGYLFGGEYTILDDSPQLFLPTAGWRMADGRDSSADRQGRGGTGRYWTSTESYSLGIGFLGYGIYQDCRMSMWGAARVHAKSVRCVQE